MNRRFRICTRGCVLVLSALATASVHASEYALRSVPADGDTSVYYDLTAEGVILEIDYAERSAREVARVPLLGLRSNAILRGWHLADEKAGYFFVHEPDKREDQLYLFDVTSGSLRDTGIRQFTGGDSLVLPVSKDLVYVRDFEKRSSLVCHPLSQSPAQDFGFDLRLGYPVSLSEDKRLLFVGRTSTYDTILKIDAWSGRETGRCVASSLLCKEKATAFCSYACFEGERAIIWSRLKEGDELHLHLVGLDSCTLLASSAVAPMGSRSEYLLRRFGQDHILYRIGVEREGSKNRSTGFVRRYAVSEGKFSELSPISYAPETHVFLLQRSGGYVVCERVRFNYVSMDDLHRWSKYLNFQAQEKGRSLSPGMLDRPEIAEDMEGRVELTLMR